VIHGFRKEALMNRDHFWVTDNQFSKIDKALAELRARFESLTPREREIMALVTAGLMNKQVAGELGLSEITSRFIEVIL
jgi:FixJ family two-component response regulator